MITGAGRRFTYNSANLPTAIGRNNTNLYFSYDPERNSAAHAASVLRTGS